ncbi:hypothetical protein ACP6PL_29540 [Dapis sp. BLCC M126]|uniref:hypothetical protein n=1 Tax=Dapis sp. BLCC M126 TaxID=3400189 RepID=UPI003CF187DB
MSKETTGLDLVGRGKLAQAIPNTAWKNFVDSKQKAGTFRPHTKHKHKGKSVYV